MAATPAPLLSTMDRQRPVASRRAWPIAFIAVALIAVLLFNLKLRPAVPSVERDAVVIAPVTRGVFVQEIAAAGSLVAEQPRLIAAPAAGRVEAIEVEPGDQLRDGEVIMRLSNREVVRQLLEADQQLAVAEADLTDLEATLQARSLESASALRRTEFERQDSKRQSDATSQLAREGLVSNLEALRRSEASQEVAERVETDRKRHTALTRSAEAQLRAQRNRVDRLHALHAFHRTLVDSLVIRASSTMTAREILVQEGEWVTEGQRLVRLVEPGKLKAVLQVAEAAAHELRVGQKVTMNARGAMLNGHISRVAAAVEQGTVAAEVRLDGDLPAGVRPDLSVEGRVEIGRIGDALSVSRTAIAMPNTVAHVYKLDANDRTARRVQVRFGASSADRIVIVSGAAAGDRLVIAGLDGRTEPVVKLD